MRIHFENHKGELDLETNEVIFYDLTFNGIIEATKFLKDIPPKITYVPWYYRGKKGLLDEEDGSVYLKDRWFPDEEFAIEIIKTGYK